MPKQDKYDQMHRDIIDFVLSNQMHSTLVGKLITIDHSKDTETIREVESLAEWVVALLKKAEHYRKDNVKRTKKQ